MSNETNPSQTNDPKHSTSPAPLLVDLDADGTSTFAPISSTPPMTRMDENHDNHNDIHNTNDIIKQQASLSVDNYSMTTSTTEIQQDTVEQEDSKHNIETTRKELETSDDIHIHSPDGPRQFEQTDDEEVNEEKEYSIHKNDTDTNQTTAPPAAVDGSDFNNTDNGIISEDSMDMDEQQQDDSADYNFENEKHNNFDDFGNSQGGNDSFAFNKDNDDNDDDFNDFGQMNEGDDDGFDDFGDFDEADDLVADNDDDDFGDFGDLPQPSLVNDDTNVTTQHEDLPLKNVVSTPSEPSLADQYIQALQSDKSNLSSFIESTLSHLWTPVDESTDTFVESPTNISGIPSSSQQNGYDGDGLLCTQCSLDLWQKVSRDSVFYNPITGSIGQFQWTRSEINRAYLNALGVRINYEDRLQDNGPTSIASSPSLQHRPYSQGMQSSSTYGSSTTNPSASPSSSMSRTNDRSTNHMRSSSLTDSISLTGPAVVAALHGGVIPGVSKAPVEEEPELDIDIAKAYCELTEETIRVFPDVKLNAMVVELSRLQRQAKEYLGYLLDQREQLMMDAETYNDLISCIVGHAQRLREQNVVKDASPAMVSKKKKTTGLSGIIKRKNTGGTGGTSMGGGVVGVKQSSTSNGGKSTNSGVGRRSL